MNRLFRSSLDISSDVRMKFKAAGVLPYFRKGGRSWFLLGRDAMRNNDEMAWSDFGGKWDKADGRDPWVTAAREFCEETRVLGLTWMPSEETAGPVVWNPEGKYLLFLAPSPSIVVPATRVFDKTEEKRQFAWVHAKEAVMYALDKNMPAIKGYAEPSENAPPVVHIHLFRFFATTLRHYYHVKRAYSRESEASELSLRSSSSATKVLGLDGSAGGGGRSETFGEAGIVTGGEARTADGGGGVGSAPVGAGAADMEADMDGFGGEEAKD